MITVGAAPGVAALGPEWDTLFDAGPDVQCRRLWFAASEEAALAHGVRPYLLQAWQAGRPAALLPLQVGPGAAVTSLTSPYTVLYQPLAAPGADLRAAGQALGEHLKRWPLVRLEALDPAWPGLGPLLQGIRQAGMRWHSFDHFGNWHEDVAGLDWHAYLAARPGALRETVRRRGRAAARDPAIRYEVVRSLDGLEAAMAAYESVYARSWKEPEPFPGFTAALLPRLAAHGLLRLGVLWRAETPVAAQYWTVLDGVATVLKLAHDDAWKSLSPGTLLTAHMIRLLLTEERLHHLDFGRGDDAYKGLWTAARRQRIGVMLAHPLRPAGAAELVRHRLGRLLHRRG